jgi:hypothetical protein
VPAKPISKALATPLAAIAVVVVAATVINLPTLAFGQPAGHGADVNVNWLIAFASQFPADTLYPRWLPEQHHGAGSPAFFFYAPLPFYITASAFALPGLDLDPKVQVAVGFWIMTVLAGLSFLFYARSRVSATAAVIGALIYLTLPYHLEIDYWRRVAFGEYAAYIWVPLCLWSVDRLLRENRVSLSLAVSYALLITSHLPSALLMSGFILVYLLVGLERTKAARQLITFALSIALGTALAGAYLVPALLLQDSVHSEMLWTGDNEFTNWFFFDGSDEPNPGFTDRLFLVLVLSGGAFAVLWVDLARRRGRAVALGPGLPWLLFAALAWLLMTPLSLPLWHALPLLQKVQYPWRAALALDMATAMVLATALERAVAARDSLAKGVVAACAASLVLTTASGMWKARNHLEPFRSAAELAREAFLLETRHDAPAFLPVWVEVDEEEVPRLVGARERVQVPAGLGRATVTTWRARRIDIDLELEAAARVSVRQFYFPGWEAVEEGRRLAIEPEPPAGLIAFEAPAGRYRVALRLAPLAEETGGAALSAAAALVLAGVWAARLRRRRRAAHKDP